MNPGFRIRQHWQRPAPELVESFAGMPSSDIDDAMFRMAGMDARIRPMNKGLLLGTAFTVRLRWGDNLLFHKAIDMALPGDVLMVDVRGDLDVSIFGDHMAAWAKRRGLRGIVIDGAIRDAGGIAAMTDFPIYAAGVQPNGPFHHGGGEIGFDIACGGVVVHPGDIVVGDEDGVVVIRPEDAPAILEKARAIVAKGEKTEQAIRDGSWNRGWVDTSLSSLGCEYLD